MHLPMYTECILKMFYELLVLKQRYCQTSTVMPLSLGVMNWSLWVKLKQNHKVMSQ